jgi:hypothetical protein
VQPVSVLVKDSEEILKRLEKHLSGELRLGLYNLLPNGSVKWAVVEFENHGDAAGEDTWLADALKYQREAGSSFQSPACSNAARILTGNVIICTLRLINRVPARTVREGLRDIGQATVRKLPQRSLPEER